MSLSGYLLSACVMVALSAHAQDTPADSTRVYELDTIVVTADRSEGVLSRAAAAVSVLQADDLAEMPVANIAGALSTVPGLVFFNRDGSGNDPIAATRGFYGGGEVSYLLVLVDGIPRNNAETGLVNWNALSTANVASIEVLRGSSSALYGDAAIGGVVNLITDKATANRFSLAAGSFGAVRGRLHSQGKWRGRQVSLFADVDRTDGYRAHGHRAVTNAGGSLALVDDPTHNLTLTTTHNWTRTDDPGYLPGEAVRSEQTSSSPFFRFDATDENRHRVTLDGSWRPGPSTTVSAYLTGQIRSSDVVRTLLLSPDFADTKDRDLQTSVVSTSVQAVHEGDSLPFPSRLTIGVDASLGRVDSRYYRYLTGPLPAYVAAASPGRGPRDAKGRNDRSTLAAFAQYDVTPVPALTLSIGGRLDRLYDTFNPTDDENASTTHHAFSPRAGVNVRFADSDRHTGHVYASVSRSFKAPTLDQLFDQRSTPVPFPPFSITISNGTLKPQRGTNVEAGLYDRIAIIPGQWTAELSLSAYRIDMKDEVDFSLQQFSYVNLGKSRHEGVESGLKMYFPGGLTAFANYAYQSATVEFGPFAGNYLKSIPRDVLTGGMHYRHASGIGGGLMLHAVRRIFLDDANASRLPNYTTLDARLSYRTGRFTVAAEVFNLTDTQYSTTGFPDPAGSEVVFFYPAAERSARLGVTVDF